MSDKNIKLTRRRILGGVATVGAASAAVGAGTFAAFSDTEQSSGNQLTAGTLDLELGTTQTLSFNGTNIKPTDSGTTYADLQKNSSSTIAGDLSVSVASVTSGEGTSPEAETETTAPGDLDDELELKLWIGVGSGSDTTFDSTTDYGLNSDGTVTQSSDGGFETATNYHNTTWSNVVSNFSGPATFNVEWRFPDATTNNVAQGDDISVDFEFTLVQQ